MAAHEPPPAIVAVEAAAQPAEEPEWLGRLEFTDSEPPPAADPLLPGLGSASSSSTGKKTSTKAQGGRRGGRPIGGSLLKPDGTSEASMVGMI